MNTQIFHTIENDLKGHSMSLKALSTKFFLAHSSISTDFDKNFVEY